jgi:hypothetical protein
LTPSRVLLWDIETSPNLGYIWGKYEQNVLGFVSEWHLLTIAWKWLGEKSTYVAALPDYERYADDPENDYELAALAHRLFSEADIVVAHNGIAFDTKKAQARMLFHGFDPPVPFKEVDTLKIARRHFAFTSNKLGDLCDVLGIGRKLDTGGFQTWLGCMRGDPKAWAKMKRYNRMDVVILEKLYVRLRPWMTTYPNVATMSGKLDACPKCGSTAGMIARGYLHTSVSTRQRFQCSSCRGYCAGRPVTRERTVYV